MPFSADMLAPVAAVTLITFPRSSCTDPISGRTIMPNVGARLLTAMTLSGSRAAATPRITESTPDA